jgi:hypothetical protein
MRPLIRISFTLVLLTVTAANIFAGTGSVKPVMRQSFKLENIVKLDSFLSASVNSSSVKKISETSKEFLSESAGRICSCQILNLGSSNYDHRYVVLLAEKTNDGTPLAYSVAKSRLQKEKKQLKQMFYDKVKVVAEMQGTGSCKSMFFRLKTADSHLKLYEILNADISR